MRSRTSPSWLRASLALGLLLPLSLVPAHAGLLSVTALNDKPGPVDIVVSGEDIAGASLFSSTLSWTADDNTYSAQTLTIPSTTAVLRLTFIRDYNVCCDPDTDRNAFIDFFTVDGGLFEAENFDRTGGTDPQFPGCAVQTVQGSVVADCGNNNDWVEYDLSFFKSDWPNYAPSGIPDIDQRQDKWAHEILCGTNLTPDSVPAGDDVVLAASCATAGDAIVGKGPNNIMETPLAGDDQYRYEFCAPVAVANCLWWMDSQFETDTGAPACDPNDTYPLVTAYPASAGDHCANNVDDVSTPVGGASSDPSTAFGELVEDLAWRMDTGGQRTLAPGRHGTTAADMTAAVRGYITDQGLVDEFLVDLMPYPDYPTVESEIGYSRDLILALSFYQTCSGLRFVGGHAVTAAGLFPKAAIPEICVSDPLLDLAEAGGAGRVLPGAHGHTGVPEILHNDVATVSHDCYRITTPPGVGAFGLSGYGQVVPPPPPGQETDCTVIENFLGQNAWDTNSPLFDPFPCDPGCPVETEVSYALRVTPFTWEPGGAQDYAPSGMPDLDQKQGSFTCPHDPNGIWSHCGPAAAANSLWYLDSEAEPSPSPPSSVSINDGHNLVSTYGTWDDHWMSNVQPLIADLGMAMNTDNLNPPGAMPRPNFCGTYVEDLEKGLNDWITARGLQNDYQITLQRAPTIEDVAGAMGPGRTALLLLGFWQIQDPGGGPVWVRIGGHYVTVSGVDRARRLVGLSDPFLDASESGATRGRILGATPHVHAGAPETYHDDAQNVSHDVWEVVDTTSPGGVWGPAGYAAALGAAGIANFTGQNSSDELDSEGHDTGPPFGPEPIVAEAEYAIFLTPCLPDQDGDGIAVCDGDCNDGNPNVHPGNTESCDGLDNDCDAMTDEDFPSLGSQCAIGIGECFASGVQICNAGGTGTQCGAPVIPPQTEACDFLDNDCDGGTDEDFIIPDGTWVTASEGSPPGTVDLSWTGGQPIFEVFVGSDPSNVLDPANSLGTTSGGAWSHSPVPAPDAIFNYLVNSSCSLSCPETCDGVDNDCNGIVDDPGSEQYCSLTNADPTCSAGMCTVLTCDPGTGNCDGIDANGCEHNVSADPNNCGACGLVCSYANASATCSVSTCSMGPCTSGFADCDLQDVNGCETELAADLGNCGFCGNVCSFNNATASCVGGSCGISSCDANWWDLDGVEANGCEYNCFFLNAQDLPGGGFVDSNCDGVDGNVNDAVFVATTGSDGNPGTRTSPKATIEAALQLAQSLGKSQVLVESGIYSGSQIVVRDGIGIYGNYTSSFMGRTATIGDTTFNSTLPTAVTATGINGGSTIQYISVVGASATTPGGSAYGLHVTSSSALSVEYSQISAGNGSSGSAGSSPSGTGGSGSVGQLGQPGCENGGTFCASCSRPRGGNPGGSSCGRTGGRGGDAGLGSATGFPGSTGAGGTAGGPGTPAGLGNWNPSPTYWGMNGVSGGAGSNGSAGASAYAASGYQPSNGANGVQGVHGNAGGGGGGGGGGTSGCDSYGGGGGGGGGGGCGGFGGGGGGSGGGSFGAYLWSSTVAFSNTTLVSGNAGDGGVGGTGQPGGLGGSGAFNGGTPGAGNIYGGGGNQGDGSNGARGGNGGNGGNGGYGGGGAGGPSIVILYGSGSGITGSGNTLTLGSNGLGGASPGNAGPDGLAATEHTVP